jgi:hypothetical protein
VINTVIAGNPVRVEVAAESSYPFGDQAESQVVIKVQPAVKSRFALNLRIPSWAEGTVCGVWDDAATFERIDDLKPGSFVTLSREWGVDPPTEIRLTVPMPVRLLDGFNGAVSIQRGPVIYALQIEPEWKIFKDRAGLPFDDWEVLPRTPWNYAIEVNRVHPENAIKFEARTPSGPLFTASGSPLWAKVQGRRLADWKLEKGAAAPPPLSPVSSQEPFNELILVPYGCTDLRVSVFPTLTSP